MISRPSKRDCWRLLLTLVAMVLIPVSLEGQANLLLVETKKDLTVQSAAKACKASRSPGALGEWGQELLTSEVSELLAGCRGSVVAEERAECEILLSIESVVGNDGTRAKHQLLEPLGIYIDHNDPWKAWLIYFLRSQVAFLTGDYSNSRSHAQEGIDFLDPHLETFFVASMSPEVREIFEALHIYEEQSLGELKRKPGSKVVFRAALLGRMASTLHMIAGNSLFCQEQTERSEQQFVYGGWLLEEAESYDEAIARSLASTVEAHRGACPPGVGALPTGSLMRDLESQCEAEESGSEQPQCGLLAGLRSLASGDPVSASKDFEQTLAIYSETTDTPSKWLVHLLLALASEVQGKPSSAGAHYLAAIDLLDGFDHILEPSTPHLHSMWLHLLDSEDSATVAELDRSEPGLMVGIYKRLAASVTHKLFAQNLACREEAIRSESQSAISQRWAREIPGVREALNQYEKVSEMSDSDPSKSARLWAGKARLLARGGKLDRALRAIDTAEAEARASGDSFLPSQLLLDMGQQLYQMELFNLASELLERGITVTSDLPLKDSENLEVDRAYTSLVRCYGRLQQKDRQEELRKILEARAESSDDFETLWDEKFNATTETLLDFSVGKRLLEQVSLDTDRISGDLDDLSRLAETLGGEDEESMTEFLELVAGSPEPLSAGDGFDSKEIKQLLDGLETTESQILQEVMGVLGPMLDHLQGGRWEDAHEELTNLFEDITSLVGFSPSLLQEAQLLMSSSATKSMGEGPPDEESVEAARRAIRLFEDYLGQLEDPEAVLGLIEDSGHDLYRMAVNVMAQANPEEAFQYAERGRAFELRRVLSPGRSRDGDGELQVKEGSWIPEEPVSLAEIQGVLDEQDASIVAYYLGYPKPEGSDLWIWALDDQGVELASTTLTQGDIRELLCWTRALRSPGNTSEAAQGAARRGVGVLSEQCGSGNDPSHELYRRLIEPVEDQLDRERLILIPHGFLHHLPFAALRDPKTGHYLVENFTLSLAPSATIFTFLTGVETSLSGEALVLGDPVTSLDPLQGARAEAVMVAERLENDALLGQHATEEEVYKRSGRLRYLHLAAHGQFFPEDPSRSRLLLSPGRVEDGMLEMQEIQSRLDLSGTELVVLSACQTAVGEVTRGEDIHGLTQAFLVAGSRAVVSTLWPIDDEASAQLMKAFYSVYLQGDVSVAGALRRAQKEMILEYPSSTYFWAGFVAMGDPHSTWNRQSEN